MSKIGRRINLSAIIASLFAVSCTAIEGDSPNGNSQAISFTPRTESRAAVSTANDMSEGFRAWGWYGTDQINNNVFDGVTVSQSGNAWTYTGGTQYWLPGYTYNFHALYPSTLPDENVTITADGTITVKSFDCSGTGTNAVDLMTASRLAMNGTAAEQVAFTFFHELARVKFTVKSENAVATIKSFKVYGVKYKGTLSKNDQGSTWDQTTICSTDDTPFVGETFEFNTTNGWEKDMLGDMLLIPDSDLTNAHVEIAYRYQGETTDRTYVVDLNTSTISQWEAGKSYNYTLTIKGGTLSITVNVVDWTTQETSVSWGDEDKNQ